MSFKSPKFKLSLLFRNVFRYFDWTFLKTLILSLIQRFLKCNNTKSICKQNVFLKVLTSVLNIPLSKYLQIVWFNIPKIIIFSSILRKLNCYIVLLSKSLIYLVLTLTLKHSAFFCKVFGILWFNFLKLIIHIS